MIYIVQTAESLRVKIGFTAGAPRKRLAKMQTDHHERLTIIRWLEGDESTEAAIHARYTHLKLHGDWHTFCPTMLDDLGTPDLPMPAAKLRTLRALLPPADNLSPDQRKLLTEITGFLAEHRMPVTTFGIRAVNDGKFLSRLRAGANMTTRTMDRAWDFMCSHAPVPAQDIAA